ncbi:hypothetical protein DSL92_02330 [Billgrantia gudaonensis]|uniref:Uncharacterized protein n=1 Tax=Billgrantia gudaonensis TaxID=376427 RepID=A0A432JKA1_9GAMM|nr:hypothetical protein DSL92_02330 [Halomonas gudaonensis]
MSHYPKTCFCSTTSKDTGPVAAFLNAGAVLSSPPSSSGSAYCAAGRSVRHRVTSGGEGEHQRGWQRAAVARDNPNHARSRRRFAGTCEGGTILALLEQVG